MHGAIYTPLPLSLRRLVCSPESGAGELGEAIAVDVDSERSEARDEDVQTEVELLATDDIRIRDVTLNDV